MDQGVPGEHRRPAGAGRRPHQPAQVADLVASRPGSAAAPRATIAGERSMPVASAPTSARNAVTWPGPQPTSTTGPPSAWAPPGRAARSRTAAPSSSSTSVLGVRRGDGVVRRAHPGVARSAPAASTASRSTAGAAARLPPTGDRPEQVHPARVLLARAALELAHQRLGGRPSAPGRPRPRRGRRRGAAVGPGPQLAGRLRAAQQQHREQGALVGARSSSSSRTWWYFRVRRPVSDHTMRTRPRSLSPRAVASTVCSS